MEYFCQNKTLTMGVYRQEGGGFSCCFNSYYIHGGSYYNNSISLLIKPQTTNPSLLYRESITRPKQLIHTIFLSNLSVSNFMPIAWV